MSEQSSENTAGSGLEILRQFLDTKIPARKRFNKILFLTQEEYRTFKLLGQGLSRQQIASLPGQARSPKTVYTHTARICEKLEVFEVHQVHLVAHEYLKLGLGREPTMKAPYRFSKLGPKAFGE